MNVKDKAECKKRFNKVKLSCLLFITVVKKNVTSQGREGGKEAQWGKNICDFAFEFNEILWLDGNCLNRMATFCFISD